MSPHIHQSVPLPAPPGEIYEALLDEGTFAAFTGAPAHIERENGGAFSVFAGQIEGRNLELAPSTLVVQAWRVAGWDRGVFSIARFELGVEGDGSLVTFDHVGYPQEAHDDLDAGWHQMYWEPLRRFFLTTS